ncbi:5348_t:CDS:1, partial [Acaulospora morrowiae]
PIKEEISLPVFNYINSLVGYIDFRRISAEIVIKLIEPLYIVPFPKIIDSCRFQICEKSQLSEFYGTPGITWDRNSCGSGLIISDDGYTVSARQDISLCQSVKANYPMMNSGVHEFHVLLEKISVCSWIGVCGEGLKFSEFAGYHNAHVLGSEGDCYINNVYGGTKIPSFSNDNTHVIVHLDMDNKTIAFSVN